MSIGLLYTSQEDIDGPCTLSIYSDHQSMQQINGSAGRHIFGI